MGDDEGGAARLVGEVVVQYVANATALILLLASIGAILTGLPWMLLSPILVVVATWLVWRTHRTRPPVSPQDR